MAQKNSTIKDFIGSFTTDLSRPCNYMVTFKNLPTTMRNNPAFNSEPLNNIIRTLRLRCESADLPSRTFALVDQKTYGPIEQYPIQSAYNKATLSFISSDDMSERIFFDIWMEMMSFSSPSYYRKNNTTGNDNNNNPIYNGVRFDFKYKEDYVVDINIDQLTVDGQISYRSVLVNAFPVELHSIPLRWSATNDYNRVVVTFAYRYAFSEYDTNVLNTIP